MPPDTDTLKALANLAAELCAARRVVAPQRWQRFCLDAVIHAMAATSGLVVDERNRPVCFIGLDESEAVVMAGGYPYAHRGETSSTIGSRHYDTLPIEWPQRLGGGVGAVLAWRHPSRRADDFAGLAEALSLIFS